MSPKLARTELEVLHKADRRSVKYSEYAANTDDVLWVPMKHKIVVMGYFVCFYYYDNHHDHCRRCRSYFLL